MSKKTLSQYDFSPDQRLVSKNAPKNSDTPILVKLIMMFILLVVGLFFIGHAIGAGATLFGTEGSLTELTMAHIKANPMDFLYFSPSADASFILVWIVALLFYIFPGNKVPSAEMKGEEHGSNDFQSIEERIVFMKRCSTGINMLDVNQVKEYAKKHKQGVK